MSNTERPRILVERTVPICCNNCGEPADYKHTFLLPNARRNPASKAYGRDDCSWCSDESTYECKECYVERKGSIYSPKLAGYGWCSTFLREGMPHLFTEKRTEEVPELLEALEAVWLEVMDYPPQSPLNIESYLPHTLKDKIKAAIAKAKGEK